MRKHYTRPIDFVLKLGPETRIPTVPKDCFGIVQVGNDIFKKFYRANFDFL